MEEISHVNRWNPTVADGTPAGSYKLVTWRTNLGLAGCAAPSAELAGYLH